MCIWFLLRNQLKIKLLHCLPSLEQTIVYFELQYYKHFKSFLFTLQAIVTQIIVMLSIDTLQYSLQQSFV